MNHGQESCPDDHFSIFMVENRKKVLVAKQSLYELRKMEFKVKRGQESMMRVEGQEHGGSVRFDQSNLMDIIHHGHKIGHIVVEYLKK